MQAQPFHARAYMYEVMQKDNASTQVASELIPLMKLLSLKQKGEEFSHFSHHILACHETCKCSYSFI